MGTVELLAPAGDRSALHAAVSAGADAVYLGLDSFNARRGADNFTVESLEDACTYAHLRGVRVYVALNTIILPAEVTKALEYARKAYLAGADAFIVQDIGFAAELVRLLPDVRLHISTQMNIHSAAGIRAAASLGAHRVTLARELSLDEISRLSHVAEELNMEVETFVHGALCVCYSGQCLLSSMIGGRSANRGMCAQACRLPYTLIDRDNRQTPLYAEGDHLLSPRDLCAIDLLDDLAEAGVSSFKIEGRMKSADYVSSVTKVYRTALDRLEARRAVPEHRAGDAADDKYDKDDLAAAFSRGFTTAYLQGKRGNEIMSYQRPNNRGQFVGRVHAVDEKRVVIAANRDLVVGDIIEFWTKHGHTALTINDVTTCGDGLIGVSLTDGAHKPHVGDRVFRVRSAEAVFHDDEAQPRIAVVGEVSLRRGTPLHMEFRPAYPNEISGTFEDDETADSMDVSDDLIFFDHAEKDALTDTIARRLFDKFGTPFPVGCGEGSIIEPARTKVVSVAEIAEHVNRLGTTPFELVRLKIALDDDVGIGFSEIHKCRAQALENLSAAICADTAHRDISSVVFRHKPMVRPAQAARDSFVSVLVSDPACAHAAIDAGIDQVYVHALSYVACDDVRVNCPDTHAVVLPVVDHDPIGMSREACLGINIWDDLDTCVPAVAENPAQMQRAGELGMTFEVGSHVPITNELSMDVAQDFGAKRVWLSPELTLHQIEDLAKCTDLPLGIMVVGAQELMVCEHCLLMSQGACHEQCTSCSRRTSHYVLKDRKDFEFPVFTDILGRSHLYNSVPLDTVPAIPDLLSAGVSSFMIDATIMNVDQTRRAVGRVVFALETAYGHAGSADKAKGTTSGHLYRGVS